MIPETSDIVRRTKVLLNVFYSLTLNSLTQLSNIVEIAKAKFKDSFHFFKALEELVDTVNMFYGESTTTSDEKKKPKKFTEVFFSDLLSDSFIKNIEANIKSESDLKLNIIRLNPIYEMILVHKFFNAAGKGSISGTTMLRKIDRHAEKNSSGIYQFAYLDGLMKIFNYLEVQFNEEIPTDLDIFRKRGVLNEKKFFEFMENWHEDYSKNKKIADLLKMKATGRLVKSEGFHLGEIVASISKLYYDRFAKLVCITSFRKIYRANMLKKLIDFCILYMDDVDKIRLWNKLNDLEKLEMLKEVFLKQDEAKKNEFLESWKTNYKKQYLSLLVQLEKVSYYSNPESLKAEKVMILNPSKYFEVHSKKKKSKDSDSTTPPSKRTMINVDDDDNIPIDTLLQVRPLIPIKLEPKDEP